MATIRSQMTLNDGMSAVLKKITRALDTTIKAFEDMQEASGVAMDTKLFQSTHVLIAQANNGIDEMADNYRKAAEQEERLNERINLGASATDGMLNGIRKIVTTLGAVAGTQKVLGLSDQLASGSARLSLVVDDGGSVDELEQKIMASAQRSRAAYLDTMKTVSKLGLTAGEAFSNNDELIRFTELVNKNFVIGGASAAEQASAMYQLTQAMGAGRLQGDEYRSIIENAPLLAKAIEDYMRNVQGAEGAMKDWASEGQLTADVIKAALFSSADEVEERFAKMPLTWEQVWTRMQNQALSIFDSILAKINQVINSDRFSTAATGIVSSLGVVASFAAEAFELMVDFGSAVADNWSWLGPIVMGVVGALMLYHGVLLAINIAEGIHSGLEIMSAVASALKAKATSKEVDATTKATLAQAGLNTALLTCPITWVVIAIIALIAIIYAVVGAINHFAGTSVSATGIIAGAFAVLGAHIINKFVVPSWNMFAAIANFFGNVFNDPVAAVKVLFYDMCLTVIGYIANLAHGIEDLLNKIPGITVDITSKLDSFYAGLEQAQKAVKDESGWVEYVHKMDYIDYGDAWKSGYGFGKGIEDKVGNMFNFEPGSIDDYTQNAMTGAGFTLDDMAGDVEDIAGNTGSMADSLDVSEEELSYLRDIAERDAINRFTTAEVFIDMTGMTNRIEGEADLDGVISQLTEGFTDALLTAAEGVHA